jgi:hypothetical protein
MPQLARRLFAIFLALAFFGAMLERSALGHQDEPCPFSSHGQELGHGSHASHHHKHTGKQEPSAAQICVKCCGLCAADAYLASAPVTALAVLATR